MGKDVAKYLIEKVCDETDKGVRTIEKNILNMFNKINFLYNHKKFDVSFKLEMTVNYPFCITRAIVDRLLSYY
jgi:hypothetical protein